MLKKITSSGRSNEQREEFMEEMGYLSADMIVWLDETGSDIHNERQKFGYHLRGMTPNSYKLAVRGKKFSYIAVMSTRGIEDVSIYEHNINGTIFANFVAKCLVPILQPFDGRSKVSGGDGQCFHTPCPTSNNINTKHRCNLALLTCLQS